MFAEKGKPHEKLHEKNYHRGRAKEAPKHRKHRRRACSEDSVLVDEEDHHEVDHEAPKHRKPLRRALSEDSVLVDEEDHHKENHHHPRITTKTKHGAHPSHLSKHIQRRKSTSDLILKPYCVQHPNVRVRAKRCPLCSAEKIRNKKLNQQEGEDLTAEELPVEEKKLCVNAVATFANNRNSSRAMMFHRQLSSDLEETLDKDGDVPSLSMRNGAEDEAQNQIAMERSYDEEVRKVEHDLRMHPNTSIATIKNYDEETEENALENEREESVEYKDLASILQALSDAPHSSDDDGTSDEDTLSLESILSCGVSFSVPVSEFKETPVLEPNKSTPAMEENPVKTLMEQHPGTANAGATGDKSVDHDDNEESTGKSYLMVEDLQRTVRLATESVGMFLPRAEYAETKGRKLEIDVEERGRTLEIDVEERGRKLEEKEGRDSSDEDSDEGGYYYSCDASISSSTAALDGYFPNELNASISSSTAAALDGYAPHGYERNGGFSPPSVLAPSSGASVAESVSSLYARSDDEIKVFRRRSSMYSNMYEDSAIMTASRFAETKDWVPPPQGGNALDNLPLLAPASPNLSPSSSNVSEEERLSIDSRSGSGHTMVGSSCDYNCPTVDPEAAGEGYIASLLPEYEWVMNHIEPRRDSFHSTSTIPPADDDAVNDTEDTNDQHVSLHKQGAMIGSSPTSSSDAEGTSMAESPNESAGISPVNVMEDISTISADIPPGVSEGNMVRSSSRDRVIPFAPPFGIMRRTSIIKYNHKKKAAKVTCNASPKDVGDEEYEIVPRPAENSRPSIVVDVSADPASLQAAPVLTPHGVAVPSAFADDIEQPPLQLLRDAKEAEFEIPALEAEIKEEPVTIRGRPTKTAPPSTSAFASDPHASKSTVSHLRQPIAHPAYNLGDIGETKDMVVFPSLDKKSGQTKENNPAIAAVSQLRHLDAAFVRRSDGKWTYALVADGDDDELRFVVSPSGATKSIPKNLFHKCVRRVRAISCRVGDQVALWGNEQNNKKIGRRRHKRERRRSKNGRMGGSRSKNRMVSPSPTRRSSGSVTLPDTILEYEETSSE